MVATSFLGNAALGVAYALAGRADEALPLVAGAVEESHRRQNHFRPAFIFLCAGMTYRSAGRIPKREAMVHQIQQILHDRVGLFVTLIVCSGMNDAKPRVTLDP